jgi:D-alanyl-D-alanine carboxypeptidase/D-alanyl-D-alanine carboxypeptidase (penicillin-binding protein 5/6)
MYDKKKILILLLTLTLIFSLFTVYIYSAGGLSLSARSAILYEPTTKNTIYSKNPDKRLGMASTTKIMSAIVALENSNPDDIVTVDDRAIGVEGSSIYIEHGESFKMIDLIYAMMLQSANDASEAIAYHIAGDIDNFSRLMNEKAEELGLCDTHFENPHGLDAENHYTTARELAVIASYALENESFRNISQSTKKEITSSNKTRILLNHNKLLKFEDGCIGVKTGFTKKSGRSLVGACERNGIRLISVTINAPDDWNDHKKLFNYGYSLLEKVSVAEPEDYSFRVPVLSSENEYVTVKNLDSAEFILSKYDKKIEKRIVLPRYLVAPVNSGDAVGKIIYYKDGKIIGELKLFACSDALEEKSKLPFLNIN